MPLSAQDREVQAKARRIHAGDHAEPVQPEANHLFS